MDGDHSGGQYAVFDGVGETESKRLDFSQAQIYSVNPELRGDRLLHGTGRADWDELPPWADAGGFQYGEPPNLSEVEFEVTAWDDLNWEGPERSTRSVLEAGFMGEDQGQLQVGKATRGELSSGLWEAEAGRRWRHLRTLPPSWAP